MLENPSDHWSDDDGKPALRPIRPKGMSGAPMLALHPIDTALACEYVGVFVEWFEERDTFVLRTQPATKWLNPFWGSGLIPPWRTPVPAA